ncbi:MAG: hypothetical protein ABW196_09610 [Solirubrobacterales bacterium]
MRTRLGLAFLGLIAIASAAFAATAGASPPRPTGLQVVGGAGAWHADNRFTLSWVNPPAAGSPLVATHYRVRDPEGDVLMESRIGWLRDGIGGLTLPKAPGTYGFEVWLEDAAGSQGPAASEQLRFDDVRPASIVPEQVKGWIGRTGFPLRVRLGHPSGPSPLSGIRGYAVTIGPLPLGSPCAAPDRCTEAETTLHGGAGNDRLTVDSLPEGTSYLHAVAVSGSGMKSPESGHAVLRVDTTDPVTLLSGAPRGWANRAVWLVASAADSGSGMEPLGDGVPPFTAIRIDGGAAATAAGGHVAASVIGEGVHRVAYYARDAAGNLDDGGDRNGLANPVPQTATVRIDRTPPNLAFANSQDPNDPELLRVRIGDPLAGADSSRGQIGVRRAGSGDRFEPLLPARSPASELRARWDSDAYPPGDYEFRAIGYDAAGNAATTTRRRNGGPMTLSNPLKATTTLRVSFHHEGPQHTVPYGRRVLLSGRLTAGRRAPLPGKPLRVVERFLAGARPATRVSTATTGPDGAFSIRTLAGPSRTIAVAFDGSPTLARSTAPILELGVRSRLQLRASAAVARIGGAPLVFRGRLITPGEELPPTGRSVQLQFRLPGLPWAEFRTVQTDSHGRFRYAYRFSDDDSRGARFQFRAYAPAQEGWPYEPAGSHPVLVRGR